jgi:hypothetical protein
MDDGRWKEKSQVKVEVQVKIEVWVCAIIKGIMTNYLVTQLPNYLFSGS